MIEALSSRWWLFLARGIAAILLAIVAFTRPGLALESLVIIFGAYAFVGGVLMFVAAASGAAGDRSWAILLEGVIGIVLAFFIWSYRGYSTAVFVYFIAGWAIVSGIAQIVAGVQLRDVIDNEWLYVLGGIISIAFGIWVVHSPEQGAAAIAWLVALYAVLFGVAQIAFSFRLRSLPRRL
ncbi:MAG: HdeD family acid-resistance protein [Vulcanimicrobiaceae bacterium]